jgi:hypothetical protein
VEALSLEAEALLLSIKPADGGGLFVGGRRRRRLRKALSAGGSSWDAAVAELEAAGLVRRSGMFGRTLVLVDRAPAGRRFSQIQERIRKDQLTDQRDVEVFILLAYSGVLAVRLPRDLRRIAAWRARRLGTTMADAGAAPASAAVAGLGFVGDAGVWSGFDSGGMFDSGGLGHSHSGGGDHGGGWFGGDFGGGHHHGGGGGDGGDFGGGSF